MINKIWVFMIVSAVVVGGLNGRMDSVSVATVEGASKAVQFILGIGGTLCFWSGIMQVMTDCKLSEKLAKFIRPLLSPIFGKVLKDNQASEYISSNITANLLGLGNAATPMGLKAAARINELEGNGTDAPHSLITLVVLNTASLQLLPTTVASVRASLGATNPYDIIIPVWIASVASVLVGLTSIKIFSSIENMKKISNSGRRAK